VGHILLHGKKDVFLENVEYDNKENAKEAEADIFASNVLLPEEQIREIAGANDFTPTAIKGYAKKFGTHQSVIVGRLQHLKIIPYNYNCQLLDKINLWRQEPIAEPTR
jgi:Zn-dependent peptidase ImmA (M78 family)